MPITPAGSEAVVTVSAGFTTMLRFAVAVLAVGVSASVTVTVKFTVPEAVGVPVIAPVAEFRLNPAGKLPVVTAHVYGEIPPVACNVVDGYTELTTPTGSDAEVVVTLSAATVIVMLNAWLAVFPAGVSESVTVTVKLTGPVVVPPGVPEITPVAEFKVKPEGRLPAVTAHV